MLEQTQNVTAIIVTYNSAAVIHAALRGLIAQPQIAELVVVDNASSDTTCDVITRDFPLVTLIRNATNEGFGRANNVALAQVKTPYALLVNPDAVLETGALSKLLAAAKQYPDAAILAPRLSDENGALHRSHKRSVFAREAQRDVYIEPEGDVCAEYLSGAVWLLNMSLMRNVGFFDPEIFLYYEDDDLCLRARKAGHGLVLVPTARAMHLMGESSGKLKLAAEHFRQRHMAWSRLYLEAKYRGAEAASALRWKLGGVNLAKLGLYTALCRRRKQARVRGRLAGIRAFRPSQNSNKVNNI